MPSNSSSSRAALIIVFVVVAMASIWILWPTIMSYNQSTTTSSKAQEKTENTEEGQKDISQSDAESKVTPNPGAENTKKTLTESADFRVSEDDIYASVPDDRFYTTSGVSDLTPEEAVRSFRTGQKVYAYAAIHAPRQETVRITWYDSIHNEIPPSAYLDVDVNTGSVGYRVFTYRTFRNPGKYQVRLLNSVGKVIGQGRFEVYK